MTKNIPSSKPFSRSPFSRRDFLKLAALGSGALALRPWAPWLAHEPWARSLALPDFPEAERLGRVAVGMVELKLRPDPESQTLGVLYEDAVLPWLRETAGARPAYIFNNQRWVETPQGYIYGPYLQPVYNHPNQAVGDLPTSSRGPGMWAEVTVPYAEAALDKGEPSSNSWVEAKMEEGLPIRVYYAQNFWVDQIRIDSSGRKFYRVNPNYYGGVDMLWAAAEAFRPITNSEIAPINPDVADKSIQVDVTRQALSCFEGGVEVYHCRVSTGAKFDMYGNVVDKWATPVGVHRVTRKYISLQMSGGTTGAGYDLPGIGWTCIFATGGVAIHSTFWHNNYGDPVSHGCVNCTPEDARWIFRWTAPNVVYDPGMLDVTVSGDDSTRVQVLEE
ncbi:MAG: L,D-transpeptidase family protein [Anaerolineales bacterium]|nr:L,D-transpeptidase family protein [Anaerolineales bacterium]